ncbi:MAG: hypothetical protein QXY75_06865 [Candidatus Bathyarchaeia archaeon]
METITKTGMIAMITVRSSEDALLSEEVLVKSQSASAKTRACK